MMPFARSPQPGTVLLGKYRVEALIGEGGMGTVVRARHIDLDEPVAIKLLLPELLERKDIVERFMREARSAVKLKGPHVARVLDVGRFETGLPYIVMEYLAGTDLNTVVKAMGAQPAATVVDLMLQACDAIGEAHSLGIIHRDIKASNFFVLEGEPPILKVLDFGIASAPEGTSDLTSTQSVMGTPAYMAPEQMRSTRAADARSDIWSIGVVLYELLEGDRPFRSEIYSELCLKVAMDPPVPFSRPVEQSLQNVVWRCLTKSVDERFQNIAELAHALVSHSSDVMRARAIAERCASFVARRPSIAPGQFRRSSPIIAAAPPTPTGPRPGTPPSGNWDASSEPATTAYTPPRDHSDPGVLDMPVVAIPDARTAIAPPGMVPAPPVVPAPATVLGFPTPIPAPAVKTPTSISTGQGQVTPGPITAVPAPRSSGRRFAVIGMSLLTVLALGGGAFYVLGTQRSDRHGAAAPDDLAPPPTPSSAPVGEGTTAPSSRGHDLGLAPPGTPAKITPAQVTEQAPATAPTLAPEVPKADPTAKLPAEATPKPGLAKVESSAKTEVPKTTPELTKAKPEVTKTKPEVTKTKPEVTKTKPEVTKTKPEVTKTKPDPKAKAEPKPNPPPTECPASDPFCRR